MEGSGFRLEGFKEKYEKQRKTKGGSGPNSTFLGGGGEGQIKKSLYIGLSPLPVYFSTCHPDKSQLFKVFFFKKKTNLFLK